VIKHILIPYDHSENANRAFEYAIDLAKKYNSKITIVSCITRPPPLVDLETTKKLKEEAIKYISVLEPKLKKLKITYKYDVLSTVSVTQALTSYVETHDIDLIVIGSRGLEGFKKLLLGSVASGVSQHSKCPVLLVK